MRGLMRTSFVQSRWSMTMESWAYFPWHLTTGTVFWCCAWKGLAHEGKTEVQGWQRQNYRKEALGGLAM